MSDAARMRDAAWKPIQRGCHGGPSAHRSSVRPPTGWRYLVVLSGADVGPAAENVLRATGSATLRFVWPVHNKATAATALNNEFEVGSDPRWAEAGVCES